MQNDANKGSLTDKFRDFGASPSDGLWDSIAGQLDEKKKRRIGFWWWTTGLAAGLLIAVGIYFYGNDAARSSSYAHTDAEGIENRSAGTPASTTNVPDRTGDVRKDELPSVFPYEPYDPGTSPQRDEQQSVPAPFKRNENDRRIIVNNPPSNENSMHNDRPFAIENGADSLRDNLTDGMNGKMDSASTAANPTEIPPSNNLAQTDSIRDDSSFGNATVFHNSFSVTPPKLWMVGARITRWQDSGREPWMTPTPDGEMNASSEDILSSPTAKNPFIHRHWSLEADIAYRFRYRCWLGSGVHVGYFTSDRKTVASAFTNAKVTAWTIGIPVNMNVDLILRDRFTLYTGVGINLDFPLQRKLQYEPGSNASAFAIEESSAPNGYLGSTQLNLGARYRIGENFNVDFRPTLRRYFECGPKNGVYLYNNWWWGVSAGVSYQF